MKTAATSLVTFLTSAKQGLKFDLWTLSLASGTTLRWTDADIDITLPDARKFLRGPIITRDRVTWVRGIQVDQLKVKLAGPAVLVDGKTLPAFAAAGGFDGAWIQLERVYMNDGAVVQGTLTWFPGQVADVYPARMGCELVVKSQLTQLSQQLPRNLYQASCLNDLYDSNCAASKAIAINYQMTGSVTAASGTGVQTLTCTLQAGAPARYFELGIFKFTSGANIGIGRTVQAQPGSGAIGVAFVIGRPFPFAISAGDTFTVTAGCDKTPGTCQGKFNNLLRFRGMPYIPVPETVT